MAVSLKPQYKEIVRLLKSLTGSRYMWEVWQDAITMFAISISNRIDFRFRDKREKQYLEIISKYTPNEIAVLVEIFAEIIKQLEIDPRQDFLGELYMILELGSHWAGQFFTPYDICQAMAEMSFKKIDNPQDVKPISVLDCACGGGALLIAAAHSYTDSIKNTGLNSQNYISFGVQDISYVPALMCYIQLGLLGFAAKIKIGDSLCDPMIDSDNGPDIWYTPMWFSSVWVCRRTIKRMEGALFNI